MRSTLFNIIVAVCGSIAFAFLNKVTMSLTGLYWWVALGLAFAICFLAAFAMGSYRKRNVEKLEKKSVGSGNKSDGDQYIEIGDVTGSGGGDKEVGSSNFAKGDQNIKIDKVRL